MKALRYLFLTPIKNSIKDLKNHPSKLILYIFFAALMIFVIVSGNLATPPVQELRDMTELYAMVFALYSVSFVLTVINGFSSGASFYSMADVSILFMTPISSKKILIFGLLKQMGTSLMIGFFLIFQYSWIQQLYGLGLYGLFSIIMGYCIVMFCAQLTAMTIYSYTSNDEKLKKILKATLILVCTVIIALIIKDSLAPNADFLQSVIKSANSLWVSFVPIVGWMRAFAVGIMNNSFINVILGIIASSVYIFVFIRLVSRTDADFYEDVLQATEVSFSAITAKKEGKISDTPKNVKIGKTGINKGFGPNVFFFKHMLENRRSGVLFIDKTSIMFIAICIFFSIIMKETGGIIAAFSFATYMQVFTTSMGRWIRELTQPYIYMIPASPFKKLIYAAQENMLKIVVEAIILFIPIGIITNASAVEILVCIFARIGFGILFMAGNILIERVLGSLTNKTLILFLYFIIMLLLAVPGFILGIFLSAKLSFISGVVVILFSTFVYNIIISALITYFCRDILNYAELNNR